MYPLTRSSAVKSARALIAASTCLAASLVSGVTLFADDAGWFFDGHHFSNREDHDDGFRDRHNKIGAVFYIELENHNFTQPASDTTI